MGREGIGPVLHRDLVDRFLASCGRHIHALELNGLRPWEPNACVNVTNAGTFAELVEEVRHDGWSDVLFMPQYREPYRLRILENLFQILQDDPQHSMGWVHWSDRVFYRNQFGVTRSLAEIWGDHPPAVVRQFVNLMMLFGHSRVRSALRFALTSGKSLHSNGDSLPLLTCFNVARGVNAK